MQQKRWVNDAGEYFTVDMENEDLWTARIITLKPEAGDDREHSRLAVSRETLEDQRGWKPAPDHGPWMKVMGFADLYCDFICGSCRLRCTRHLNEHERHYHPKLGDPCPHRERERDGYALIRASAGDWDAWLPPAHMIRVSPDQTPVQMGQVWACRSRYSAAAAVVEIGIGFPRVLARRDVPGRDQGFFNAVPYACDAVLVRASLEATPILPSQLFDPVEPPVNVAPPDIKIALPPTEADWDNAFQGMMQAARGSADAIMYAALASGTVEAKPPKKEATINGRQYSFASMEILLDGKPLKVEGIKSIVYPGVAVELSMFSSKFGERLAIEVNDRLDPFHWYLRSSGYDYGFRPQTLIVPPSLHARILEEMAKPLPSIKPARHEVSTNGRLWLDYERLNDPDPFESYTYRRIVMSNGYINTYGPPVQREESFDWQEHLDDERIVAEKMDAQRLLPYEPPTVTRMVRGFGREQSSSPILAGGIWSMRRG